MGQVRRAMTYMRFRGCRTAVLIRAAIFLSAVGLAAGIAGGCGSAVSTQTGTGAAGASSAGGARPLVAATSFDPTTPASSGLRFEALTPDEASSVGERATTSEAAVKLAQSYVRGPEASAIEPVAGSPGAVREVLPAHCVQEGAEGSPPTWERDCWLVSLVPPGPEPAPVGPGMKPRTFAPSSQVAVVDASEAKVITVATW